MDFDFSSFANFLAAVNPKAAPIQTSMEYLQYIVPIITAAITGLVTYMLGRRRSAKSEFSELVTANKKFRDEIKIELDAAKETILRMEKTLEEKGKLIEELQTAIADLKQQIISRETKISDMQMELIKKEYQIQMMNEGKK
jgi:chromosome segregation ATPase